MSLVPAQRLRVILLLSSALAPLVGCGMGIPAVNTPDPAASLSGLSGTLFGGKQPIVGATVSLIEAGYTGYGSATTTLSSTQTASDGSFSLPTHSCTGPDRVVYVQATGGNAGTASGTNSAIDLVALVGTCSTVGSSTRVTMNEATTVAAAYALAQFASVTAAGTGIGTSSTNITGLNNVLGPASLLVSYSTGNANVTSTSAGIVLPTAVVNTLADALAACTNSSIASSQSCTILFNATAVGGVKPVDTFQAALNIALHPGTGISAIFGLVSSTGPFQPTIATATPPNDFTLAIGYNGGGIANQGVNSVAIDAAGNAWVTDFYTSASGAAKPTTGLIEITPTGQYPGGATGFGNSVLGPIDDLAIDQQGNIWLTVNASGSPSLTAFTSNGNVYTTLTGVTSPNGIAIDSAGDVWYSQAGNSNIFAEFVNKGGGTYTAGVSVPAYTTFGVDVCITPQAVWNISYGGSNEESTFTQYLPASNTYYYYYTDGGYAGLSGCAVDNSGNLYLSDAGDFNGVEVVNATATSVQGYAISSAVYPQEVVLDGVGNIFVATYVAQGTASYNSATANPASLVELNSTGALISPTVGYLPSTGQSGGSTGLVGLTSQIIAPGGLAIDGSGNVWLSGNDGQSVPSSGNVNTGNLPAYVTEVIGIAAPVVTPKSVALTNRTIAARP